MRKRSRLDLRWRVGPRGRYLRRIPVAQKGWVWVDLLGENRGATPAIDFLYGDRMSRDGDVADVYFRHSDRSSLTAARELAAPRLFYRVFFDLGWIYLALKLDGD